ncbi:MAG: DUF1761 domain-containing protein [Bacteroidia bacterium]|nr:DUF1761 domain-containing protein [Bacteroidia bacterium]
MQYLEPILGGLAAFALGFLWYTALFGKAWQAESGITDEQAQSGMAITHGLSFVMMCWIAFGLSTYMNYHDVAEQTFTHGAFHGGMTALSFALPLVAINYLYQKKSLKLFLIDAGYALAFFALSGGVVGALKLGG